MKKAALTILAALAMLSAAAQQTPRWLRQNAISPDGKTVAFVYQGDIWTVPAAGGEARQLTTNPAHDTEPVWSPDGKYVVFASYREGHKDLWAVGAQGGTPKRLTAFAGAETPYAVAPDGQLYYGANIQEDAVTSAFPGAEMLYRIPLAEALAAADEAALPKPEKVSASDIAAVSVNAQGTVLYEDVKGYEDAFRKHHTSSVTRDIWMLREGVHTKLTDFVGEDRNPVFAPDGESFFFISERGNEPTMVGDWAGDANIWKQPLAGGAPERITSFKDNPVRYLSVSAGGTLCFSWNGDLYTLAPGGAPQKLEISLIKDRNEREHVYKSSLNGIGELAVSPNGKELAFVVKGDVYVTTPGLKDTRRITETPEQERGVSFGKDGRSIYYASERNGEWGIYRTQLKDKKDKFFTYSYDTEEERVTPEGQTCFQPSVSPDGKLLAYLRNRTEIVVRPVSGGKEKILLPEGTNYSYSDGDLPFEWSPDSRYILTVYQGGGRMYNEDIALISVEDGTLTDLTESGYSDVSFRWAMGGKAMTWETDKNGFRSHGSWGAEGDICIMFFDDAAWLDFNKPKEVEDIEKLLSDDSKDKKKKDEPKDSSKTEEKPAKLKLELNGREDRILRLTRNSGHLGDHFLSNDGKKLYYTVRLEKGRDLCCLDVKEGGVKVIKKNFDGSFVPAPDGKAVYVVEDSGIQKLDPSDGSTKAVSFHGEYEYFADKERSYIFEHCWKQVGEKWYDPGMHGVDWKAVGDNYRQFLPYITDNFAFCELLSEMLGELNGSHTGARYRHGINGNIGHIGVLFDTDYDGEGLRIKEFLPGSMLLRAVPGMKEGALILSVDGKPVAKGTPWYVAFERKGGKRIALGVRAGKKDSEIYLTPSRNDSEALYLRWVRRNEQKVAELSGGRVGYVHVEGMNSPSFREVYSKALGKYRNCDALIVDTRHNGGGWLHNDLATFLDGKLYTERRPRGVYMAPEPYDKWIKPSCVLVCEDNYSDACGFPYVYRALGTGKIIGAPVPGTATSVWWEHQVDPTLIFGMPQIGSFSISEGRWLENLQLEPDVVVYNDPAAVERGEDAQLEAAVREMMKGTDDSKHTIMTANVRITGLKDDEVPGRRWEDRRDICKQVILSRKPDIVCMQEVIYESNEWFRKNLNGYASYGFDGPEMDPYTEGYHFIGKNVIFYRKDRYEMLGAGVYWLSDDPLTGGSASWGTARARHANWLRLRDRRSGKVFRILDVHLDHISDEARKAQAELIVKETSQYAEDFPQIICGDFNSGIADAAIKTLKAAGWKDQWEAINGEVEAGFTGHGWKVDTRKKPGRRIDFIFSHGPVETVSAEIIKEKPKGIYPSDHFFVVSDVIIR